MTATNHALTGSVIALIVKEPWAAVPLALASHFFLDILPHFGVHTWEERRRHLKVLKYYFAIEAIALLSLVALLWLNNAPVLLYVCSFVAMSPDFVWGYRFIFLEKLGKQRPPAMNWFNTWHSKIQTRESITPGVWIEIGFALCMVAILTQQLA